MNVDQGDGLGGLDHFYVSRYHCGSSWKSGTDQAQMINITRSIAHTNIHNLGANIWQMGFAQFRYVNMLFLVEFADRNDKRIGLGCSASSSREDNGKTDAMKYHTGTTAVDQSSYGFCQHRSIEGWWDNIYDWMDRCCYDADGLNVTKNPNQLSDNTNGVLVGEPTSGYPNNFAVLTQSGLKWALYPSKSSGSATTCVPDSWDFNGSDPCLRRGGCYNQGQGHGPFCVYFYSASYSYSFIGCRLQEHPSKAA